MSVHTAALTRFSVWE